MKMCTCLCVWCLTHLSALLHTEMLTSTFTCPHTPREHHLLCGFIQWNICFRGIRGLMIYFAEKSWELGHYFCIKFSDTVKHPSFRNFSVLTRNHYMISRMQSLKNICCVMGKTTKPAKYLTLKVFFCFQPIFPQVWTFYPILFTLM